MDAERLLDPKNDAVFKRLFTRAPHLLAELINAVRADEPALTVVEILNPDITPEDLSGKQIILDLLARDPWPCGSGPCPRVACVLPQSSCRGHGPLPHPEPRRHPPAGLRAFRG